MDLSFINVYYNQMVFEIGGGRGRGVKFRVKPDST